MSQPRFSVVNYVGLAVTIIALGLMVRYALGHKDAPPQSPPPPIFNFSWDRDAGALKNARAVVLVIEDSNQRQEIELDTTQVRIGALTYTAFTENVRAHLKIRSAADGTVVILPIHVQNALRR